MDPPRFTYQGNRCGLTKEECYISLFFSQLFSNADVVLKIISEIGDDGFGNCR